MLVPGGKGRRREGGFGAAEFLVSTVVVMGISVGIFHMLTGVQAASGYQTEVLSVTENVRVGMSTIEHYILQAGNDPRGVGFTPLAITGTDQLQLCTDLTGLAGGDRGDPDGDILDADENVTIRYRLDQRAIQLVAGDGSVRVLARYISGLSFQYFDKNGTVTANAADVRKIRITVSGASAVKNPRTGKIFGLTLSSDFTVQNRWIS